MLRINPVDFDMNLFEIIEVKTLMLSVVYFLKDYMFGGIDCEL